MQGPEANVEATAPERKQFALTANPLNLLIGRFGFNFEYQPIIHHALIVSPHFDYLSGDPGQEGSCSHCEDTLIGAGAEIGYRFYSGNQGYNGFFAGPSLIVSRYKSRFTNPDAPPPWNEHVDVYNTLGAAFDVGGQFQVDHFVFGGGVGVQYAKLFGDPNFTGRGIDVLMEFNTGRNVQPRVLLNLGYAF